MNNIMFISWEKHQRTRSFCKKMNIPLEEVLTHKKGILRYWECITRTYKLVKGTKPSTLIIQNPSIVLACFTLLIKPLMGYKLIVDAHNEAIIPLNFNYALVRIVAKFILRFSDLTLVTNNHLVSIVNQARGRAFVLPDFLPELTFDPIELQLQADEPLRATLICTYAADEPYQEVFKAAAALGSRIQLTVTGKIPRDLDQTILPTNVLLTGFIPDDKYWYTLNSSHLIIDLTTRDNCLVCGAYEAIALKKPLLLSNNPASLNLFGDYAMHIDNTYEPICSALQVMISDYSNQILATKQAATHFIENEKQRLEQISSQLAVEK